MCAHDTGAYGIVWKATCIDKSESNKPEKEPRTVALKKIFDAFQNSTDAQRTYREILYLRQMQQHENVVSLLNVHKAENDRDIYLVFEVSAARSLSQSSWNRM